MQCTHAFMLEAVASCSTCLKLESRHRRTNDLSNTVFTGPDVQCMLSGLFAGPKGWTVTTSNLAIFSGLLEQGMESYVTTVS